MQDHLDERDLKWLSQLASSDRPVDGSIPPVVLGRLLKFGLVQADDRILRITTNGRARLDADVG